MNTITKHTIFGLIDDSVSNFLYYERKHDEEVPIGTIENMLKDGRISVEEICNQFVNCIKDKLIP